MTTPTNETRARRERDAQFRPNVTTARLPAVDDFDRAESFTHVLPERHVWEHARAIRVPASVARNGPEVARRPDGEYEQRCGCDTDHDGLACACEWWYVPASPDEFRAFAALEHARALIGTIGRALADADASARRAERSLATLQGQTR